VNRSVPVDTLLPHLAYVDVDEAVRWLSGAFGFSEHFRYGEPGSPDGAQLHLGDAWVMVFQAADDGPAAAGQHGATLTVFVEDVDGHCARARAAGATITEEPNETVYGEYQYGAADLAGRHWLFARHARDVDPREWGATVAGDPPAP
jgi:uncharacterized glyoxalase superfamily protein PhnB